MYIIISGQHSLMDRGKALSILYCVILIIFGVVLPIVESLKTTWGTSYRYVVYTVFLQGVSMLFIFVLELYLFISRKSHKKAQGNYDVKGSSERQLDTESAHKRKSMTSDMPGDNIGSDISRDHRDEVNYGRGDLYLPIGAALFGLGCMVYDAIRLKSVIECPDPGSGGSSRISWPIIVQLVFLLFQMYFILKHPRIKLQNYETMVRLGLMHILATNICTWIRSIIRETHDLNLWVNGTILQPNSTPELCIIERRLDIKAMVYLFPISIQYLIVGAAAAFSVWTSLQCGENQNGNKLFPFRLTDISLDKAHKGLFAGLVIVCGTIISIIMFFFYLQDDQKSRMLYIATDGIILLVILITVLIGWTRFRTLSREPIKGAPTLRALLLVIAMVGFVLFNLCRTISSFVSIEEGRVDMNRILEFSVSILSISACVFQTLLIIDAMKRRCVSEREFLKKPGRGCATFLLLSNFALWLFRIFQMKVVTLDFEYHTTYYTGVWWQIIVVTCVPLSVFYHFQASACLGFVWTTPYRKSPVMDESFTMRSASQEISAIAKGDYGAKLTYETSYREYPGTDSRDATLPWVRAVMNKRNKSVEREPEERLKALDNYRERPTVQNLKKRYKKRDDHLEYEYDTSAHLYRRFPSEVGAEVEENPYAIAPDHRSAKSGEYSTGDTDPPPFYGRIPPEQPFEQTTRSSRCCNEIQERPQIHHYPAERDNGYEALGVPEKEDGSRSVSLGRKKPPNFIFEDPKMKASDV